MDALDGNSIAGALAAHFGEEMSSARGSCSHCGAVAQIAELQVFGRAPGTVVRCRACGCVVIVLVEARGELWVDMSGFPMPPRQAADQAPTP